MCIRDRLWTATESGSLLTGTLPEHSQRTLSLDLRSSVAGEQPFSLRLALSSAGADYLNAPFGEGERDASGYLALESTWTFSEAYIGDTADSAVDTGTQDTGLPPEEGCGGCSGVAGGEQWLFSGLLTGLLLLRRRRGATALS